MATDVELEVERDQERSYEGRERPYDRDVFVRREIVSNVQRPSQISWGAIFAGLTFLVAGSWMLYLLGAAVGLSVADATDSVSLSSRLGLGVILWMVTSFLIVYFLGSLLTARLTGKTDPTIGMLHGLTLWAVGTTAMVVLSAMGVAGLMQTAATMLESTASTAAAAATGVAQTAGYAGAATSQFADTRLAENIQARLKRAAAAVIADSDAQGGPALKQEQVRQAMQQLNAEKLQSIAAHLIAGESEQARQTLAGSTTLTQAQINDVIRGVSTEIQERLGQASDDDALATDVRQMVNQRVAGVIAAADAAGGPDVTRDEIRQALRQLDAETLQAISNRLMDNNIQGAKDVFIANTTLTEAEVNDIVEGVRSDVQARIDEYKTELNQTVEAASTYSQGVLWTIFAASAMGLVLSIFGGLVGVDTTRRLMTEVRQHERV